MAFQPTNGQTAIVKGATLNMRSNATIKSKILEVVQKGATITYTGRVVGNEGFSWYEVQTPKNKGYVRADVLSIPVEAKVTEEQAKDVVDKLVKSDELIYHNILLSLEKIASLTKAGIPTTKENEALKVLYAKYQSRQEALRNSKMLKCQTGIRQGFEKLKSYLSSWISGVGVVLVDDVGAVIFFTLVGVGIAAGLYYTFKPKYDESQIDLKESQLLKKALDALTPAEQKAVKADLEKQIDNAYNQGNTDGTFGAFGKVLLYGGFAFGAVLLFNSFNKSK